MPGKIRDESLEAGEFGQLEIFARACRRAGRRQYGRRSVEPLLGELAAEDVIALKV